MEVEARAKRAFERFIHNASEITESWQIVAFFEDELQKFKDEISDYENSILKEKDNLKAIRSEYLEVQNALKSAQSELESLRENRQKMGESMSDSIDNLRKNLPINPLSKVEIRLKDGIIVKANPANDVYSKEIAEKYLKSLWELKFTKAKLLERELENAKLRSEIKNLNQEKKLI